MRPPTHTPLRGLVVVWALVLLSLPETPLASVGTCIPWNYTSDSHCVIPDGTPIFISAQYNLQQLAYQIERSYKGSAFFHASNSCVNAIIAVECASAFRPCLQLENGTVVPVPVQPCRYLCETFLNECEETLTSIGVPLYIPTFLPANDTGEYLCNVTDPVFLGDPRFPLDPTNYTINGTIEHSCFASNTSVPPYTCNSPLSLKEGGCSFTCPLPSLTNDQYLGAKIMQGIVGWISWVASATLIVSYLLNPQLRRFPKGLIIMTAMAANVLAGGIVLPTFAGHDEIWCGGQGVVVDPASAVTFAGTVASLVVSYSITDLTVVSSPCSFQGALILFGILACTFWWAIIAFNMCFEIFFSNLLTGRETLWKWIRMIIYALIGWGFPFLAIVIPASAGKIGFVPGSTFCFISPADNNAWSMIFFFIPMGILLVLGLIFFTISLIKLIILAIRLRKLTSVIIPYSRVLLFVCIFFMVYVFFIAYVINNAANEGEITSGYEVYFECLPGLFGEATDCSLSDNVSNFPLVILKGFAISCFGALLFFTFLSWQMVAHWWKILKAIFLVLKQRRRQEAVGLFHLVVTDSFLSRSSLSGGGKELSVVAVGADGEEEEVSEAESSSSSG